MNRRGRFGSTSRRILLASYHFPPAATVGGLRIAKFARLLPEFGWEPYVLTIQDDLRAPGLDQSRMEGLEGIPIVRTSELPRVLEALQRITSVLRRPGRRNSAGPEPSGQSHIRTPYSESLRQRLTRYAVSMLFCLPDGEKNWSLYAAGAAVRLVRRHRIDWVLTSGPPFSGHVIGWIVKACTSARWIADFRDPWVDMLPDCWPGTRSRASDRIQLWMEGVVAKRADKIVTTTERMREAMASRYPLVPSDKFVCIPNSIDTERLQAVEPAETYEPLTITYTGSLYFDRTPEPLFRAVSELVKGGQASPRDIRIKLVGQCRYIDDVETQMVASRYGLERIVEVIDPVPYSEAVRIMRQSHLLLLLAPERHRLVVPAKIYDYLGSGTAILTLAEPGATADLVAETRCGRCFSPTDIHGLRDYLAGLLERQAYNRLGNDPKSFWRYGVRPLTERLVAEMAQTDARLLDRETARR